MSQEEHAALESAFIDGFRAAHDKPGFLRLAQIPLELDAGEKPGLKLMQVAIDEVFDVGRASPGFGTRELVYHPVPASLVAGIARLRFRYVSADELRELTLAEVLGYRSIAQNGHAHSHMRDHDHHHGHGHHHHHD